MKLKWALVGVAMLTILIGCGWYNGVLLDRQFGQAAPRIVTVANADSHHAPEYFRDVKPVFDQRCVVCHGCYDAPCQLKLTSPAGIDRGANKDKVYDGTRLLAANLTRLYVDAQTTAEWRGKNFYPVVNEREDTAEANRKGGVLYQMLALKQQHPMPSEPGWEQKFDVSLDRNQQCPKIEEFDRFAKDYPLWGMPYALPGLTEEEFDTIARWLEAGAPIARPKPLPASVQQAVIRWEAFFNQDDLKSRLVSRYIYEHLFLAHLYFSDLDHRLYFKLVRSVTPPGQPIEIIATRRPFENPGVERVYYRLQPVRETILAKTHMPYRLDDARMKRWKELFFENNYIVTGLPSYAPDVASNPFAAFRELPVKSRYRFMLDEAEFTIMGFIKGPVCRGQVALNVINDRFWVAFVDPDMELLDGQFLAANSDHLHMPAEASSNALPISSWLRYSKMQEKYLQAKANHLSERYSGRPTLDLIWDGDGSNGNAALTVMRHYDSATVVKGWVGATPKTAWVVSYQLLERIHYLLVAGFDVYGNVGHQLLTRLYMDYLRMEGEYNFLHFMPLEKRNAMRESWYRGVGADVRDNIYQHTPEYERETGVQYQTEEPKQEFFELMSLRLGSALNRRHNLARDLPEPLRKLTGLKGESVSVLPEISLLRVRRKDGDIVYSLIHDSAHSNVALLFFEEQRRLTEEDELTLAQGFIGAYPNTFFDVDENDLPEFVSAVSSLAGPEDLESLLNRYGIRRNNAGFWKHSDWFHRAYQRLEPVDWGMLDYNRYIP